MRHLIGNCREIIILSWLGNSSLITGHLLGESLFADGFSLQSLKYGALILSLLLVWASCSTKSWVVGDLRRHYAIVMSLWCSDIVPSSAYLNGLFIDLIGKTPVRIILWCPITKMLIKACFLVQPLEQEGVYQKCCISLCSKVFINHFYEMKASPECLNILLYFSKYWVDRLRRTIGRKV